jgi:TonB family protein
MSLRGHVSVSFNVHKNGAITDVAVVAASGVDAFNNSSFNAIAASNPTVPLPPEYPSDRAFITVTFYYNETPPSR